MLALAAQHHHAHAVVLIQLGKCLIQFGNQLLVKRVEHIGAVHPDGGNRAFALDAQCRVLAHADTPAQTLSMTMAMPWPTPMHMVHRA